MTLVECARDPRVPVDDKLPTLRNEEGVALLDGVVGLEAIDDIFGRAGRGGEALRSTAVSLLELAVGVLEGSGGTSGTLAAFAAPAFWNSALALGAETTRRIKRVAAEVFSGLPMLCSSCRDPWPDGSRLSLRGVRGAVPVAGVVSLALALMNKPSGFFDRPLYKPDLLPTEVSVPAPVAMLTLLLAAGVEKKRPLRLLITYGRLVPPPLELCRDVEEVVTSAGGRPGEELWRGAARDEEDDRSVLENEYAFEFGRCSWEEVGARGAAGADDAQGSAGYALGGNGEFPGLEPLATRTKLESESIPHVGWSSSSSVTAVDDEAVVENVAAGVAAPPIVPET